MKIVSVGSLVIFVKVFLVLVIVGLVGRILFVKLGVNKSASNKEGYSDSGEALVSEPVADLELPSQVLNLTNWKITLPTGPDKKATEIKQPELSKFVFNPWYTLTSDGEGVRFRAAVNGSTTSGSDYPRTELREMSNNGKTNAAWNSGKGVHTMTIDQAITSVPKTKRDVVAGQIHDGDNDIIVVRLNYPLLHIRSDSENVYTLDSNYELGKRFTIRFVVRDNKTYFYYNNSVNPVYVYEKSFSNAYFKAGAYTQSNCDKENGANECNDDNFGEVVIYNLSVSHE